MSVASHARALAPARYRRSEARSVVARAVRHPHRPRPNLQGRRRHPDVRARQRLGAGVRPARRARAGVVHRRRSGNLRGPGRRGEGGRSVRGGVREKRRARLTKPACASTTPSYRLMGKRPDGSTARGNGEGTPRGPTGSAVTVEVERKVKGRKTRRGNPGARPRGSGSVRSILLRVDVPKSVGAERVLSSFGVRARARKPPRTVAIYQSKRVSLDGARFDAPVTASLFVASASPRGRRSRACSRAAPASSAAPSRGTPRLQLAHGQAQGLVQRTHLALRTENGGPGGAVPPRGCW